MTVATGYGALLVRLGQEEADLQALHSRLLVIQQQQQETSTQLAGQVAWARGVVRRSREARSPSPVLAPGAGQNETPGQKGPEEEGPRRSGRKRRMTEKAREAKMGSM